MISRKKFSTVLQHAKTVLLGIMVSLAFIGLMVGAFYIGKTLRR